MNAEVEENISTLLSSASLVAIGGVLGSASTVIERVVIGRLLAPAAFGEASIGIAIVSLATTVALLGFSQGIARYIPRYDSPADKRGVWVSAITVTGALAVGVTALVYTHAAELTALLFERPDSPAVVTTFVLAIPLLVGMRVGIGSIRGFENTVYRTVTRDVVYPVSRIGLIVVLVSLGYGLIAVSYAYLAAAAVSFLLAHLLLHRLIPLAGRFRTHTQELLRFSAPLVVSGLLAQLLVRTDTLMLGALADSYQVAIYNAAHPLAGGMLIVLSSFGFMYLPLLSRLDAADKRTQINRIYETTTKWIYVVTFPAFLTFVCFPADVLRIFFGPTYTEGSLVLIVLSVGFFGNAILGRNRETLSALGYPQYLLVTNGLAFVVNLGLNLALIPRLGVIGAAIASASSYLVMNGIVSTILLVQFGISPFSPWSIRTYVLLPAVLFPPGVILSTRVDLTAVTLLPFLAAVGLASVAVVTVAGCLQPEDWIALEFVEERLGIKVPLVRQYLPQR